jgi:hypothetical protein
MKIFDDDSQDVKPRNSQEPVQSGNNCDIFEPSTYVPESAKYRAEYIRRITAKITAELDNELATEELPDGEEPSFDLEVSGMDPEKHFKFIAKYLRGPRGFNGNIDNFVVLTEAEYDRLVVKDPNKFYFTYEGEESQGYVENMVLITTDFVNDHILVTTGQINNNILTI